MSEGKRVLKKQGTAGKQAPHQRAGRLVVTNALLAAVVLLTLGALAWFYSQKSAATVTVMGDPADLAIVGADGGELLLDMSPASEDATATNVGITVHRLFGVKTANDHWIEIAHTTNTDGFSFKIYSATPARPVTPGGSVTFTIGDEIQGHYLNEDTAVHGTASTSDAFYHGNFTNMDRVQMNAVPLYWIVDGGQVALDTGITYYYLEVTWTETEKETDVIYIFVSDSVTQ